MFMVLTALTDTIFKHSVFSYFRLNQQYLKKKIKPHLKPHKEVKTGLWGVYFLQNSHIFHMFSQSGCSV